MMYWPHVDNSIPKIKPKKMAETSNKPRMMNMNKKITNAIAALLVVLVVWFYCTPYLAVNSMRSAAEEKNAAKLSGYVDFPAVKEDLKATFNAKLSAQLGKEKGENPFADMGDAMAAALINPIVEALVTPESLAIMMEEDKEKAPQPAGNDIKPSSQAKKPGVETSMAYEGLNRFVFTVTQKNESKGTIGFVFLREGIFSWKLAALRLPI